MQPGGGSVGKVQRVVTIVREDSSPAFLRTRPLATPYYGVMTMFGRRAAAC